MELTNLEKAFLEMIQGKAVASCGAIAIGEIVELWESKNRALNAVQRQKAFTACSKVIVPHVELITLIALHAAVDTYISEKREGLIIAMATEEMVDEFVSIVENRTSDSIVPMFFSQFLLTICDLYGEVDLEKPNVIH